MLTVINKKLDILSEAGVAHAMILSLRNDIEALADQIKEPDRDEIAMFALQGMMANSEVIKDVKRDFKIGEKAAEAMAKISYIHADAMLKARKS